MVAVEKVTKTRVAWVDVAKILGMFAIFVGHLTAKSGDSLVKWVFMFSVPLFFFLAGCMETRNERGFFENLLHKIKTIIIPLYIFAVAMILVSVLVNGNYNNVPAMGTQLYSGFIRNHSFGTLWFLSCLFVMEIVFSLIKRLKKWYLILGVCLGFFAIAWFVINPTPIKVPSWWWNVDSMLFYIPFFALGYILYPIMQKVFNHDKRNIKIAKNILGWGSVIYLISLFMGKSIGGSFWAINSFTMGLAQIVRPLICVFAILFISKQLEGVKFLSAAGKHTLIFCGGEYIAREIIFSIGAIFGVALSTKFDTPIQAYIFAGIEMIVVYFVLKPIFSYIISRINVNKILSKW